VIAFFRLFSEQSGPRPLPRTPAEPTFPMDRYCRFEPREQRLAALWSQMVVSKDGWTLGELIGRGESGARRATGPDGQAGIVKSAFWYEINGAAHEKIASDLAYMLGIPVPPVALWQHPDSGELYSISAAAFKQPINWDEARILNVLTSKFRKNARPILSAGFVFHSWIGDKDHGENPGNVLVNANSSPEHPGLAFVDHCLSMSYKWSGFEEDFAVWDGPYYGLQRNRMDVDVLTDCVGRIMRLSKEDIVATVRRIPPAYLPTQDADLICQGLLARRERLSALLVGLG
jgi:hypothetical protein